MLGITNKRTEKNKIINIISWIRILPSFSFLFLSPSRIDRRALNQYFDLADLRLRLCDSCINLNSFFYWSVSSLYVVWRQAKLNAAKWIKPISKCRRRCHPNSNMFFIYSSFTDVLDFYLFRCLSSPVNTFGYPRRTNMAIFWLFVLLSITASIALFAHHTCF